MARSAAASLSSSRALRSCMSRTCCLRCAMRRASLWHQNPGTAAPACRHWVAHGGGCFSEAPQRREPMMPCTQPPMLLAMLLLWCAGRPPADLLWRAVASAQVCLTAADYMLRLPSCGFSWPCKHHTSCNGQAYSKPRRFLAPTGPPQNSCRCAAATGVQARPAHVAIRNKGLVGVDRSGWVARSRTCCDAQRTSLECFTAGARESGCACSMFCTAALCSTTINSCDIMIALKHYAGMTNITSPDHHQPLQV